MASRLMRGITALSLAITFYFSSTAVPVRAGSAASLPSVKLHTFKFYLDPALVPDMAFAKSVLPKYVADMNLILGKSTSRQLAFDPETDIILTDTKPETGSARSPLPTEDFEIWAHAIQTWTSLSYGGYASVDSSGAGVVDGMRWTRLYDPDHLGTGDVQDYTRQISTLLHELAHIFGAGIGEYYSLISIDDTTNTEPLLDIDLNRTGDPYWSDKQDFRTDPLLQFTLADSRDEYLAKVEYSSLTASILNAPYRNGVPSFDTFTVRAVDRNGVPIAYAKVQIWSVLAGSPFTSQLLYDVQTDETGQVTLAWGGTGGPHNVLNLLRLIKIYADGLPVAARYVSIFDSDRTQFVEGQSSFLVEVRPPVTTALSFNSLSGDDGWVRESGKATNRGGALNAVGNNFLLGNDAGNRRYRSVLAFNTAEIPDNAIITSVTLKVRKEAIVGADPFTTLGRLVVDITRPYLGSTPALQAADFQARVDLGSAGTFAAYPDSDGWYSSPLKAEALGLLNLNGATQFRLRFTGNARVGAAYLALYSGNAAPANRPILVVEYQLP